jgi:capsular exopolysaccharide synthesis family protein
MSKIYEALRQAELDRANAAATPTDSAAEPQQPPVAQPLNLAFTPQHLWTPQLQNFPALEDSGHSVEQFRSLRSRMQQISDASPLKSILIASGLPQEGKSFIAVNLALSFANHKASRVLLIDGDMRSPSLHRLLGCPNLPGLSELLAGQALLSEVIQRPSPSPNPTTPALPAGLASLHFIPGGNSSEEAADLSGNRRFDQLIADVSPHFDWIVVDSSPVNLVSDAVNLARACDGVLLVARSGRTKYATAQRAVAELKAARVLGFVLNAVKDPPTTVDYYSYDASDKAES